MEAEPVIVLSVAKFKEPLVYGWHLLPFEKQVELIAMGVQPEKVFMRS
jgi:hypothetical protein